MRLCVLDGLKIPQDLEEKLKYKKINLLYETHKGCEAVLIRNITKIDKKFLEKNPFLKYVIRAGVGLDNVDLEMCKERGIKVINAPGSNAFSVAELFFFHVLNVYRKGCKAIHKVKRADSLPDRSEFFGNTLKGKNIGIIGLGYIGKEIAKRLQGWEINKIFAYDIIRDEDFAKKHHIEYVDNICKIFRDSDIIAICIPLTKSTEGMINYNLLKESKRKPIIVNLSRGRIVNEKDIIKGLNNNIISYYCTDVLYEDLSPTEEDKEIISHKRTYVTPHIGANTKESLDKMVRVALERFLEELSR